MKKIIISIVFNIFLFSTYGVNPGTPGIRKIDAKQLLYPIDNKGNQLSLFECSNISK